MGERCGPRRLESACGADGLMRPELENQPAKTRNSKAGTLAELPFRPVSLRTPQMDLLMPASLASKCALANNGEQLVLPGLAQLVDKCLLVDY